MAPEALARLDHRIIRTIRSIRMPLARCALFVVFFWFGGLKVFTTSPANPLVAALLGRTLPFLTFADFIQRLGIYEMAIGVAFLIPGLERLAIVLLLPHMITTCLPLVLLPQVTWTGFLTLTLEGPSSRTWS